MRLFIGLPLPPHPAYGEVTHDLVNSAPGVRPVPEGSWHVTLRFLGEVADAAPVEAALAGTCSGLAALPAAVTGVGGFPDARRARVAWAGVEGQGIEALARRVVEATARFGEPPDRREFRAHATLARLREPTDLRGWVARHRATSFGPALLDRVVLFSSAPTPQGARYDRLAELPLEGQP